MRVLPWWWQWDDEGRTAFCLIVLVVWEVWRMEWQILPPNMGGVMAMFIRSALVIVVAS